MLNMSTCLNLKELYYTYCCRVLKRSSGSSTTLRRCVSFSEEKLVHETFSQDEYDRSRSSINIPVRRRVQASLSSPVDRTSQQSERTNGGSPLARSILTDNIFAEILSSSKRIRPPPATSKNFDPISHYLSDSDDDEPLLLKGSDENVDNDIHYVREQLEQGKEGSLMSVVFLFIFSICFMYIFSQWSAPVKQEI